MNEFKPILKNNNFLYIWTSQILSQLTINIMNFVLLIRLFENTGSTIATSLLWVAYSLPAAIVGPIASASVDILDRRKVLMITNLLQSLTIFLFALSNESTVFLVYGVVMVYSLLNQFYVPAESATLPSVIKKDHLPFGNSLFFMTQQGAIIAGFGIAGLLNHLLPFTTVLYLCSSLVFLAFVSTLFLPSQKVVSKESFNFEEKVLGFMGKIVEGYKFIKGHRSVLAPFGLLMGVQVILQVVIICVPVIAKDILAIPVNSSSLFVVIPAAIGALSGAFIIPKLIIKGWRKKKIILSSLEVAVAMFFFITFISTLIDPSIRAYFAFLAVVLIGGSFVGITVPSNTFLQEVTPADLRGRVFGNFWFLVTVASVFPVIFSGTVIELFGIKLLMFILTAVMFCALFFAKRFKLETNGK